MFRSFFNRASVVNIRIIKKLVEAKTAIVKFKESLTKKREKILYTMSCLTQTMRINNVNVNTLLNSDVKINVMSEKLIIRTQLSIRKNHRLNMINVIKAKSQFVKVCEKIEININEA